MTIRKRLAFWYSGLLTLIILIFGIAVITISRITLLNAVDNILISTSDTILETISMEHPEGEESGRVEFLFHSEKVFHIPGMSVQIWRLSDDGQSLERASADVEGLEKPLDPNFIHSEHTVYNSTIVSDIPERVLSLPLHNEDEQQVGLLQIAIPVNTLANANDQLLFITVFTAFVCILLSVGLGFWLSAHMLKPIAKIKDTAASIVEADDLATRIQWDGAEDELGELAQSFNRTMERLEQLFKVQQRFIGDVSHELRTPLTSIFGHLEIMERYGFDKESLEAAHREAVRMSRMVNDLLLLTRADAGELKVDLYPVDLDTIAHEVCEQIKREFSDRDLEITAKRIEHVRVNGNSDRIRQLLINLLNNAVSFTNDGGKITVSVYQEGQTAIIKIQDTGIGISGKDIESVFDRFFQADEARTRNHETDGAGLGLSIAKWIVDIHRGTIEVKSKQGEGSIFTVRLPLS